MSRFAHYELLAELFEYPARDYPARIRVLQDTLADRYPLADDKLGSFARALPGAHESLSNEELDEMQEIFTRSFDVQSITTLSVGYIMFGDDYKRGELLVNLNREQREAGIEGGSELSDHLPKVLRLIARWRDEEMVVELVEEILHPALVRMIEEFDSQRMKQRNKLYKKHFKTLIASSARRGAMYRDVLAAVVAVLEADFGLTERERPAPKSDFLRSIDRELHIEANESLPAAQAQPAAEPRIHGHPALVRRTR
ncbi:MAG: hypothetical protein GY769_19880 [bacterium]|nr:hypothetical protein [bacterium]